MHFFLDFVIITKPLFMVSVKFIFLNGPIV